MRLPPGRVVFLSPSCSCQGAARQERRIVRDLLDLPVRIVRIRADQLLVVCWGGCACRALVQIDGRQAPVFVIRIPQDVQLRVPRVHRTLRALLGIRDRRHLPRAVVLEASHSRPQLWLINS